jgi:hypothetical protein
MRRYAHLSHLGAGASLANARHFRPIRQQDTLPPLDTTFFQTLRRRKVELPDALRNYIRDLGSDDPSQLDQMRMEEFFKDIFFDFQSAPESAGLQKGLADRLAAMVDGD